MPIDYKKVQSSRRKTLFPLSGKELCLQRVQVCWQLRIAGNSIAEIRQIMRLTPDKVRNYLAKGERLLGI